MKIITKSAEETQKFAEKFAQKLLQDSEFRSRKNAIVIGLVGDLGAGKTVFCQGFARALKIKQNIHSPTFVIMKKYRISSLNDYGKNPISKAFRNRALGNNHKHKTLLYNFIHIDAYRLQNPKEILDLGWDELIQNPRNIIIVEWADKIKKILPKNYIQLKSKLIRENKREISIKK